MRAGAADHRPDPATPGSPAGGVSRSPRRSHDGVKVPGWGRGRGPGGAGAEPIGGRRVPGAGSRERGAGSRERSAPGWGRGPSGAERERARPSPESRRPPSRRSAGPAAAAPAMEQDNSPRKIQFTVPLLEPHLDPEAAEQVRSRAGWQGTRPATDDGPLGCGI